MVTEKMLEEKSRQEIKDLPISFPMYARFAMLLGRQGKGINGTTRNRTEGTNSQKKKLGMEAEAGVQGQPRLNTSRPPWNTQEHPVSGGGKEKGKGKKEGGRWRRRN